MSSSNPILNNPYEEPLVHYATNLDGELDYERVVAGRRVFTPEVQSVPVRSGDQRDLIEVNDSGDYGDLLVNLMRREVKQWRVASYPNTTRVTKELLTYWFLDPERENRLFFAQREAIESAIWLNEVADRSNPGQHILSRLSEAQHVNGDAAANLPRIAFKMATGSGKTVVMAALIAYHFCNRQEYRSDVRFADNFLAVAPGITIRDRLGVLSVHKDSSVEGASDYYSERLLVPHSMRKEFGSLNAHLAITNFHAFQPRALQGNKRSPFDGKIGADGEKTQALEDYGQVIKRLLPGFRVGSRLLVLNDEAHHCYLPKQGDQRKAEGEDTEEENARAAVWFRGLVELARKFKIRAVYDLSATPYYLTGSGYEPYSLFPWVVSDFGLTEAIKSGLVKIPFLPTSDDTDKLAEPVLRNLYEHAKRKECYETRHSHVNVVVLDSGWEGQAAKVLDDLAAEKRIETWVKNYALQFRIPYVADDGESRDYLPDFIVRTRNRDGTASHLIVEVTGARRDKWPKVWTASERWVPAVNALPVGRDFGRLGFSRDRWRDSARRFPQHSPQVARCAGRHQAPHPGQRDEPAPRA